MKEVNICQMDTQYSECGLKDRSVCNSARAKFRLIWSLAGSEERLCIVPMAV